MYVNNKRIPLVPIVLKSMRNLALYLFFAFVSSPFLLRAQIHTPTKAEVQPVKNIDDILSGEIMDAFCDSSNFVWVCDGGRIIRYDGHDYTNIDIRDFRGTFFIRFFEDDFGRPWIISLSGHLGYIENDKLYNFKYNDTLRKLVNRARFQSFSFDGDSVLHVGTNGRGCFRVKPNGQIENEYRYKDGYYGLVFQEGDSKTPGISWALTLDAPADREKQFYYLDNNDSLCYSFPMGRSGPGRYLPSVQVFPDGSYFYSTGEEKLFHFDDKGLCNSIVYDHKVIQSLVDTRGGVWLGTDNDGIHYYPSIQALVSKKTPVVYLKGEVAAAVCEDQENGIWLKSSLSRLHYITAPQIQLLQHKGLNEEVSIETLHATKKWAYVASDTDINRIDRNGTITQISPSPIIQKKAIDRYITSVHYDTLHDCLWVGGNKQLYYWKNNKWYTSTAITSESEEYFLVKRFIPTPDPEVMGVMAGEFYLLIRNDSIIYQKRFENQKLLDAVFSPDGRIWLCSDKGIGYLENDHYVKLETNLPEPFCAVLDLHWFKGKLWYVGYTRSGYIDEKDSMKVVVDNPASYIFPDSDGQSLWFSSRVAGLLRLDMRDGLPGKRFSYHINENISLSNTSTSFVWGDSIFMGSPKGMFIGCESELDSHRPYPEPYIKKIFINGEQVSQKDSYTLAYDENLLQMEYTGISQRPWSRFVNYRYKMEGLRDEWFSGKRDFAQFTNMAPGDYTFILQTYLSPGPLSPPLKVNFTITPPFWQVWWFRTLVVLAIVLIIFMFFRYRLNLQRRQSEMTINNLKSEQKALRAQINPHFIYNALSSIQQMVYENDKEDAADNIALFASLMRQVLDLSQQEYVLLRQEVEVLKNYILLESLRFSGSFRYEIKVSEELLNSDIQVLPLLLQPIVENAIKHGLLRKKPPGGQLYVRIQKEKDELIMEVEDDGIGRVKASENNKDIKSGSFGLRATQQRLELINSIRDKPIRFVIRDLINSADEASGTLVQIRIPL